MCLTGFPGEFPGGTQAAHTFCSSLSSFFTSPHKHKRYNPMKGSFSSYTVTHLPSQHSFQQNAPLWTHQHCNWIPFKHANVDVLEDSCLSQNFPPEVHPWPSSPRTDHISDVVKCLFSVSRFKNQKIKVPSRLLSSHSPINTVWLVLMLLHFRHSTSMLLPSCSSPSYCI